MFLIRETEHTYNTYNRRVFCGAIYLRGVLFPVFTTSAIVAVNMLSAHCTRGGRVRVYKKNNKTTYFRVHVAYRPDVRSNFKGARTKDGSDRREIGRFPMGRFLKTLFGPDLFKSKRIAHSSVETNCFFSANKIA